MPCTMIVVGNVCRKWRTHLEFSYDFNKNYMILTFFENWENGIESEMPQKPVSIEERLSDDVFTLFCIMEEEIRHHQTTAHAGPHDGLKKNIMDSLTSNEDLSCKT